jgi:hypothetical protein
MVMSKNDEAEAGLLYLKLRVRQLKHEAVKQRIKSDALALAAGLVTAGIVAWLYVCAMNWIALRVNFHPNQASDTLKAVIGLGLIVVPLLSFGAVWRVFRKRRRHRPRRPGSPAVSWPPALK